MSEPDPCHVCGHALGPHSMIATTGNPLEGGIGLCPVPGCLCFFTWAPAYGPEHKPVPGGASAEDVYVPPMGAVEAIRALVQAAPS